MPSPLIDERNSDHIINQAVDMIPFYTPEWGFDPNKKEPGAALFRIFTQLYTGIINRLNRVPDKNHLAFLNMLGVNLLPPQPARVPVTFVLSSGAAEPVNIPAGTQLAAQTADGGKPIVFETVKEFSAIPVKLEAILSASGDNIWDHSREAANGQNLTIFTGDNVQQHYLYITHPNLDGWADYCSIQIDLTTTGSSARKLPKSLPFNSWQYDHSSQWKLLSQVLRESLVQLKKSGIDNKEAYWIRYKSELLKDTELQDISLAIINSINNDGKKSLDIILNIDGSTADNNGYQANSTDDPAADFDKLRLFYNNSQIETMTGINPFGPLPRLNDCFYIGYAPIFSKINGMITISLDGTFHPPDTNAYLSWEYWNGSAWIGLNVDETTESGAVSFNAPSDLQTCKVNGIENHWLRVRIANGGYCRDKNNPDRILIFDQKQYIPPVVTIREIKYHGDLCQPTQCMITNNLETETIDLSGGGAFTIYRAPDTSQALYLGMSGSLLTGVYSCFLDIKELDQSPEKVPLIDWEYLTIIKGCKSWCRLPVKGEACNLTRSGTIKFIIPADLQPVPCFGQELYWIRAVDRNQVFSTDSTGSKLEIRSIHPNTVWAEQAESVTGELVQVDESIKPLQFKLSRYPVVTEDVWIDEYARLSEAERISIRNSGQYEIREVCGQDGQTTHFWIKWQNCRDLLDSGTQDRHYQIDRNSGEVVFGNGQNGALPPAGPGCIMVDYRTGGGVRGNVAASAIKLQSSVAYVDHTVNPVAAGEGADSETTDNALIRGTQILKHRERAVAPWDYECLAREASRLVVRSKCIPDYSGTGSDYNQSGYVTVLIVPDSQDPCPTPGFQLLATVQDYLEQRSCCVITSSSHLKVRGPAYYKVTVTATLATEYYDQAAALEGQARQKLAGFLHPLTGGENSDGWAFGRIPHVSDFYSLLQTIPEIDYINELTLSIEDQSNGPVDTIPAIGLIYSGEHNITVNASAKGGL